MEKNRNEWLLYMLGYMTAKGWKLPEVDVKSFKKAFPEIPERYIYPVIEPELKFTGKI